MENGFKVNNENDWKSIIARTDREKEAFLDKFSFESEKNKCHIQRNKFNVNWWRFKEEIAHTQIGININLKG